ncbi:hypothetical protein LCGC14_1142510 [marine sediment metagenome]|uniref:Uncharacterized protein n=1 Tax=marine sediment metagenome TaxID=412755 RepID=A0A0F9Q3I8_9ZZZZ
MEHRDFPQHVLDRAEAASEMAYEAGGEVAGEMAYHAVLDRWAREHNTAIAKTKAGS